MKKIENLLLLPVLVLFCLSFNNPGGLDFHLHDTYFVIAGVSLWRFFAGLLLILFGLYKTIRNRHYYINLIFAVPHILITILLTALILFPFKTEVHSYIDWSQVPDQKNALVLLAFLLIQVIFLIYFIVKLTQRPVSNR
jgi:hypothetical protein